MIENTIFLMNARNFALEITGGAGKILIDNYNIRHETIWHKINNFKINVDHLGDQYIRKKISEKYPKHNIFLEEGNALNQNSKYSWVFDPLDGTITYTSLVTNYFSVSMVLVKNKQSLLEVIFAKKRDKMYVDIRCQDKSILVANPNFHSKLIDYISDL